MGSIGERGANAWHDVALNCKQINDVNGHEHCAVIQTI